MQEVNPLRSDFQARARERFQREGVALPAFTPAELPKGLRLPSGWRRLLADQAAGRPLDWKPIWGPFLKRLPAVRKILPQFSAVAVGVQDEGRPVLAYLRDWGDMVGATYGPAPVARSAAKSYPHWNMLPAWLQDWYTGVHNGWHTIDEGLFPLHRMFLASKYVTPEEIDLQPGDKPLDLDQVVVTMKGGLGTWICLDAADRDRSGSPKGLYWDKGYAPIRGNAASWINDFLGERFLEREEE